MHVRKECKHGVVVETCRCIDGNKQVVIVMCPEKCHKRMETSK